MNEKVDPITQQEWLLPYKNPLTERMTREFFGTIPRGPGIYRFFGEGYDGQPVLLYVGKAKNLRARLNSYRYAKPGKVSRKVIRLINLVRRIEWEDCETETAALLRENQILREEPPPFNVVNTKPHSYYFIAIRQIGGEVRFRLTVNPKRQGDLLFGAYKSRGLVRDGYTSLLRLIWASQTQAVERFEFPSKLVRQKPAYLYSLAAPEVWFVLIKQFLNGTSSELLSVLTEKLLDSAALPPFYYHLIQSDLETAKHFFERCLQQNRRLRLKYRIKGRFIPQEMIDDLLVLESEGRKRLKTLQGVDEEAPGMAQPRPYEQRRT